MHPVAHARATMNDRYLARSASVRARSQAVVGDALRGEVGQGTREPRQSQCLPPRS